MNLYGYVYNNPVNYVDPYGLLVDPVTGTVVGVGTTIGTGSSGGAGVVVTVGGGAAGVGVGTVAVGVGGAVVVGGAIGYGASQLPVVGGGTVADFWGDVIYDTFWPKPKPVVDPQAWMGHHNSYERRYRQAEDDCLSRLEKYQDKCKSKLSPKEIDDFMKNCMKDKGFGYPPIYH